MAATPVPLAETPDVHGAYPRLSEGQLATLEPLGTRRRAEESEVLFREGDTGYDLFVVLAGKAAITQGSPPDDQLIAVHGPGRFLGELSLLTGEPAFFTATVVEAGEVLQVPVARVREQVAQDEGFADLILRAFLQRREILIDLGAGAKVIGSCYSPDTRRLLEFLARNRVPHRWIDLEQDAMAEALLRELGVATEDTPVVICRSDVVMRNPSNAEVARALNLSRPERDRAVRDLVVVGAGPAGLAAAVYGASEGLDTVALEGVATGGQAGLSTRIENYLGFPAGISGAELAERARLQAEKFGARIDVPAEVVALRTQSGAHVLELEDGTAVAGRAVVVATGAHYRRLPIAELERFEGSSVFYAATLMEARVCTGDPIAVVGGGNSAGQATLFLSRFASRLRLLVREDSLDRNMSRYLGDRIERAPNVEVLLNTEVRAPLGGDRLEGLVVEDNVTGARRELEARALFVFIGVEPHTSWLQDVLALDGNGFVLTGKNASPRSEGGGREPMLLETSRPRVLAAGDVRAGSIKRVASAVGEGSMAVRLVHELLGAQRGPVQAAQTTGAAQTNASST
jgi:thioredoxin reductase (NADPH)